MAGCASGRVWLSLVGLLSVLVILRYPDGSPGRVGAHENGNGPAALSTSTSTPTPMNAMAVDADPDSGEVDLTVTRDLTEEFDISTNIVEASAPYGGYWMGVEFDDAVLAFVPVGSLGIVYTGLGGMMLDAAAFVADRDGDTMPETTGGSGVVAGTMDATGQANLVRFQCIAPGASTLHLITAAELPAGELPSTTIGEDGSTPIATLLGDADVTCTSDTPTPTTTPTPTVTPTTTPTPGGVGGIAEAAAVVGASTDGSSSGGLGPESSAEAFGALSASVSAVVLALVAGVWYARRRCPR